MASVLFCFGLLVTLYPHINGKRLERESLSEAASFIAAHPATLDISSSEAAERPNAELYEAMKEYNRCIYEEKQSRLSDPLAYETAPIDLKEYGIIDAAPPDFIIKALNPHNTTSYLFFGSGISHAGEPKQTSHSLYQQNYGLHSPAMYVAGVFIVMVLDIYHIKRDDTMRCTIEQNCPYL